MSFWVALGTVAVCGMATAVIMHAAGVVVVADTLTARGQMLLAGATPEDATPALAVWVLLAAVVEAVLVKLTVGGLTTFRISLPRALAAGLASSTLALLPLAAMLGRPDSAAPGTITGLDAGVWMLALPLSLAVLGLHALLIAGLSEPRRSSGAWSAYNRAVGRG